jgi:2-polyprenyl-6-methoxyphenol hydroxylase-like FAD-dependent oxidoreductase
VSLTVLVAGGGVGGLCLAQGLRSAGVPVRVFERDSTGAVRRQGYRLRIDEHGMAALARCLPGELFELFLATANPMVTPRGAVYDDQLRQVAMLAGTLPVAARRRHSTATNRATLREILLAGLADTVRFGCEVVAVRQDSDEVVAELAGGRRVRGDVLVAADGINSVVRRQLLPHASIMDTGLRGIYGRAVLDRRLREVLPEALLAGSPRVTGPGGVTLALGSYQPRQRPPRAAARLAPYARLRPASDYMKWALVGEPAVLGLSEEDTPARLHGNAARLTADWHPALVELVRRTPVSSVFTLPIRAALPVEPWPTTRVTLLGDAIHATTPAGGTGANVALRDAALLTESLAGAARGRVTPLAAIEGYEAQMREYGFAAAVRSLHASVQCFGARLPAPI